MEIENRYKNYSFGIASNLFLLGTMVVIAIYNCFTPQFLPDENHSAIVFNAFAEAITTLEIFIVGCLISLSCAGTSLLLNEKKLFPLLTITFVLVPLALLLLRRAII